MNYKDVIDRGFKRKDMDDHIYFDEKGYNWFLVEKTMLKTRKEKIYLEWDCDTHEVFQVRMNRKNGNILGKLLVRNLESLDAVLKFWGKEVGLNQQKH